VYRTHVRPVFAFFSYSVTRETAEDLTSLTFERVLKAWDGYDPQRASERTWVLAIARNALTDHFRRQSHRSAVSLDEHPGIVDSLVSSDDPLARQLAVEGFTEWLRVLPPRDREILALRFGADLAASEIAAALDMSEGNVHQVTSRALRRLRTVASAATDAGSDAQASSPADPA